MKEPTTPLFLTAFKLEFDDELEPRVLYRVIATGTEVECKVIADRIPDIVYPGERTVKSGAVIVTRASELEGEALEEARIFLP